MITVDTGGLIWRLTGYFDMVLMSGKPIAAGFHFWQLVARVAGVPQEA